MYIHTYITYIDSLSLSLYIYIYIYICVYMLPGDRLPGEQGRDARRPERPVPGHAREPLREGLKQ